MPHLQTNNQNWLRKAVWRITTILTVKYQLLLGTIIMLAPLVLLSFFSKLLFTETINEFDRVVIKIETQMNSIMRLNNLIQKAPMPANDYLIHGDKKEIINFEILARQINNSFHAANSIEYSDPRVYQMLAQSKNEWVDARQKANKILAIKNPQRNSVEAEMMEQMDFQFDHITQILDKVFTIIEGDIKTSHAIAHTVKQRIQMYVIIILLAGLIASIATAYLMSQFILKPLYKIKEGALRLSSGDMSSRINCYRNDELGELADVFNYMADMLEEDQKVLHQQAVRDELTGLFNRREFQRRLDEEMSRTLRYQHPLSMMMMDIDHFKNINDTYGHPAGDRVLREIAHRLTNIVRPMDVVMRYGGEEFTVLLPETGIDDARAMAERIRIFMETHEITLDTRHSVTPTMSIGVAEFYTEAMSASEFLSKADAALYTAKHNGRNQVCVSA